MGICRQRQRKKLEAVASYWAGDRGNNSITIDQDVISGLIAANAPPDVIESARRNSGESDSEDCEVWPENWLSVMLFLAAGSQWVISDGRSTGIHYPSLESIMNMQHIRTHRRSLLMDDIRIMEETALSVFRKIE